MGDTRVVNDVCEKDHKIIIDFKGNRSQPCDVAAIMPNAILGCINRTIVPKSQEQSNCSILFHFGQIPHLRECIQLTLLYTALYIDIKNATEYYNDSTCFILLCLVIFKLQTESILHRLAVKLFSSNLLQKQPQHYF